MKIAIGADHRGFPLKEKIKRYLIKKGNRVNDFGADSALPVDYPDYAFAVARSVAGGKVRFGILLCLTGQGMTMAANKVKGVRAALCTTAQAARLTRAHNDANVLVIPGSLKYSATVRSIISTFFATRFEGGRHKKRVDKIHRYEYRYH
ncbi:ribose 5-phosphate isomerase B [candidate division WOR-3 bacterium]|nr:ribose 5-phosphate isomerase B [candidate division WOR-3 bacterium]